MPTVAELSELCMHADLCIALNINVNFIRLSDRVSCIKMFGSKCAGSAQIPWRVHEREGKKGGLKRGLDPKIYDRSPPASGTQSDLIVSLNYITATKCKPIQRLRSINRCIGSILVITVINRCTTRRKECKARHCYVSFICRLLLVRR